MEKQNLIDLAKKVAGLRSDLIDTYGLILSAKKVLEKTPENKRIEDITEKSSLIVTALGLAEADLKSAILATYKETGEKKPIDKVEVKIFKSLRYNADKVLAWCRANAPSLLVVNKKPFEKTAVAIGAPVEIVEEEKCTIAKDLSIYLDSATDPALV